jgi:hypothetical protein
MKSPIDKEVYIIEIKYDNYKESPLDIEFIDPVTGERGTKNAYPSGKGTTGSFFHPSPAICHPCCRKAYKPNLHAQWGNVAWQLNPQVGSLTTLKGILLAIYFRISNEDEYAGRMHA